MELLSEISGEQLYKTNVLFVPLGDNSRWDSAKKLDSQCTNYQAPVEYINSHPELNAEVRWGTLSDYFTPSRDLSTLSLSATTIIQADHPDMPTRVVITSKPGPDHARREQKMLSLRASKTDIRVYYKKFIENHNFCLSLQSSGEKLIILDMVLLSKISG